MHAGSSFSYSPISVLLKQSLSIKKSYAGAIQGGTNFVHLSWDVEKCIVDFSENALKFNISADLRIIIGLTKHFDTKASSNVYNYLHFDLIVFWLGGFFLFFLFSF